MLSSSKRGYTITFMSVSVARVIEGAVHFAMLVMYLYVLVVLTTNVSVSEGVGGEVSEPVRLLARTARGFNGNRRKCSRGGVMSLSVRAESRVRRLCRTARSVRGDVVGCVSGLAQIATRGRHVKTRLGITARVRTSVLPYVFPTFPSESRVSVCTAVAPTGRINKSFCSFFVISSERVTVIVTSISKGKIPTTLFVIVKGALVGSRARPNESLKRIFARIGGVLYRSGRGKVFVATFRNILSLIANRFECMGTKRRVPFICHERAGACRTCGVHTNFILTKVRSVMCGRRGLRLGVKSGVFRCASKIARTASGSERLCKVSELSRILGRRYLDDGPRRALGLMGTSVSTFMKSGSRFSSVAVLYLRCAGGVRGRELLGGY